MRINIQAIKKRPYEKTKMLLDSEAGPNFLEIDTCSMAGPISLELNIEFTGRSYYADGVVSSTVLMQCSRCLKDFVLPISGQLSLNIVESEFLKEFSDADDVVPVVNDEADLTRPVYEALLIALPVAATCQPDCKGLCPTCGRDLNTEACQCVKETIDPRWEKLAQLSARRNTDGST